MDKWRTLEPVKLHATALPPSNKPGSRTSSRSTIANAYQNRAQYIGRLPSEIHLRIFQFLSIPDIPAYARSSRALSTLSADDRVWKDRWNVIIGEGPTAASRTKAEERMRNVLDELERRASARRTTAIAYGHSKTSSGSVDLTSVGRTTGNPQFSNGIRASLSGAQPTIEDDFGDFATADLASDEFDDFIGATPIAASMNDTISRLSTSFSPPSLPPHGIQHGFTPFILVSATRGQYAKAHALLKPLVRYIHPSTPPHTLLPTLLPTPPPPPQPVPNFRPLSPPSLQVQAQLLSLLTRFLSPTFQPTRDWEIRSHALKSCIDVFEATVLKLFEDGDSRHDEKAMREAAWAAWEVHTAWVVPSRKDILGSGLDVGSGLAMSRLRSTTLGKPRLREWEVGKVWIERKEEFYVQGKWDPLANFTESKTLSFDPMDSFMHYVLTSITSAAMTCNVVFPASSCVLLLFTGRFANDVISEYLNSLLTKAKEIDAEVLNSKGILKPKDEDDDPADTEADSAAEQGHDLYLQATAASFVMSWKIVETLMATSEESVERQEAEAIVFKMFDPHMDEYLDEEVEAVKRSFDSICQEWDMKGRGIHSSINPSSPTQTRFLTSHNPQLVKRNVVASFTDVLMLPVTIIPRAVGAVGTVAVGAGSLAVGAAKTTGSLAAGAARSGIAGISMLNPVKWSTRGREAVPAPEGYVKPLTGDSEGAYMGRVQNFQATAWVEEQEVEQDDWATEANKRASVSSMNDSLPMSPFDSKFKPGHKKRASTVVNAPLPPLDLFLSLDVALELIHAARDSMKRLESFFPPLADPKASRAKTVKTEEEDDSDSPWSATGFPGPSGRKLRETLEEIFILLLISLRERHLDPGFERAISRMQQYTPVAPGSTREDEGLKTTSAVAPLLGFFELVHIGDTIGSMIQVYFDKEMAPYIDTSDFLSAIMREKKKFENALDEEVAKGLNTGTDVLMTQVEHVLQTRTTGREYCPPEGTVMAELSPTWGCREVIECLDMHCRVLKGSTSREVLEVFYAEVGMRLHALIQKHIKRQIVSMEGGVQVIADLNAYYNFILSLKVAHLLPEFASLKMLGHVYVVADAKDLATIVRDVARYGGAFRPEDVYEFVQRRSDWKKIEKEVDRTMYNLSFKEDCVIC